MSALSRREFITYSFYNGAMVLSAPSTFANEPSLKEQKSEANIRDYELTPLVKMHKDNIITFYCPSPEMGHRVDTSLALLFVEELGGNMDLLKVEQMGYQTSRDDEGNITAVTATQFSGDSTSIHRNIPLLREAGATARKLLLQTAAKHFVEPIGKLKAEKSIVINSKGEQVTFGKLIEKASKEIFSEDFKQSLNHKVDWKITAAGGKRIRSHP